MTCAIDVERLHALGECEGYTIESPEGSIGWVEEVWLGEGRTPRALALRTVDGTRALLLPEQVAAIDHDHGWVVVAVDLRLRELDPPRLTAGSNGRLTASWTTTGRTLERPASVARLPLAIRLRPARTSRRPAAETEWPIWKAVAVLYCTIALLLALMITLAFTIAWGVTGTAY
jgi:hypothetical protein